MLLLTWSLVQTLMNTNNVLSINTTKSTTKKMFQFKTVPTVPTTSTTELVEINVGGKKFATTLKTIQAIPFFKNNAKEIPTIKTRVPPSARTIQQQPQVNPFQTPVVTPIQPQIVQPPQEKTFSFQDFLSFDP